MLGGDVLAVRARDLLSWEENPLATNIIYLLVCIALVLFAGMMSGLTLGLMSMDIVELEVLRRSGSDTEARQAARIIPVIKDAHFLLVTLLLCNAMAMEALPIFLNKLVHEVLAIIISVTAVLLMGEVIPQAVCSKYGLVIGSMMALPVRILMLLTSPLSFPIAKLLDFVLGGEHASLFRRKQLKALVTLHARDEGFGGRLTSDEIQIITGALDLTRKTAYHAMTPLDKVFMLSSDQKLDDATVSAVMASKPFSRLPVYKGANRQDIVGVILVKELLEYVKNCPDSLVSSMKIRQLPRLTADTPMYDLLKLFRVGRSHMALLTQPLARSSCSSSAAGLEGPGQVSADPSHASGANLASSQHARMGGRRISNGLMGQEDDSYFNQHLQRGGLATVHEASCQHHPHSYTNLNSQVTHLQAPKAAGPGQPDPHNRLPGTDDSARSVDSPHGLMLTPPGAGLGAWQHRLHGAVEAVESRMLGWRDGSAHDEERQRLLPSEPPSDAAQLAPGGDNRRLGEFASEELRDSASRTPTESCDGRASRQVVSVIADGLPHPRVHHRHRLHQHNVYKELPVSSDHSHVQDPSSAGWPGGLASSGVNTPGGQPPAAGLTAQLTASHQLGLIPSSQETSGHASHHPALLGHDSTPGPGPLSAADFEEDTQWLLDPPGTHPGSSRGRTHGMGSGQLPTSGPSFRDRLMSPQASSHAQGGGLTGSNTTGRLPDMRQSFGDKLPSAAGIRVQEGCDVPLPHPYPDPAPHPLSGTPLGRGLSWAGMGVEEVGGWIRSRGSGQGMEVAQSTASPHGLAGEAEGQGEKPAQGQLPPAHSRSFASLKQLFARPSDQGQLAAATLGHAGSMQGSELAGAWMEGATPGAAATGERRRSHKATEAEKRSQKSRRRQRRSVAPPDLPTPATGIERDCELGSAPDLPPSPKSHSGLSTAVKRLRSIHRAFKRNSDAATQQQQEPGAGQDGDDSGTSSSSSSSSSSGSHSSRDDLEDMLPVPMIARPGEAIGIITIEDVIEELMGVEILDETDRFMDNEQSIPINLKGLEADLPEHLKDVLTVAERAKFTVLGGGSPPRTSTWMVQAAATATGGVSGTAHSSGQPATTVLADLAGSVFRQVYKGIASRPADTASNVSPLALGTHPLSLTPSSLATLNPPGIPTIGPTHPAYGQPRLLDTLPMEQAQASSPAGLPPAANALATSSLPLQSARGTRPGQGAGSAGGRGHHHSLSQGSGGVSVLGAAFARWGSARITYTATGTSDPNTATGAAGAAAGAGQQGSGGLTLAAAPASAGGKGLPGRVGGSGPGQAGNLGLGEGSGEALKVPGEGLRMGGAMGQGQGLHPGWQRSAFHAAARAAAATHAPSTQGAGRVTGGGAHLMVQGNHQRQQQQQQQQQQAPERSYANWKLLDRVRTPTPVPDAVPAATNGSTSTPVG